jgi:hypothetical protein
MLHLNPIFRHKKAVPAKLQKNIYFVVALPGFYVILITNRVILSSLKGISWQISK